MDRKNDSRDVLLWGDRLSRWLISLVFLIAAVPKLFNVSGFAAVIEAYAILPDVFLLPAAVLLPVVEIVLAVGLLLNRLKSKIGITVLLLFLLSFYPIRSSKGWMSTVAVSVLKIPNM